MLKTKADQLERWERMKLDNEHKMHMATKVGLGIGMHMATKARPVRVRRP